MPANTMWFHATTPMTAEPTPITVTPLGSSIARLADGEYRICDSEHRCRIVSDLWQAEEMVRIIEQGLTWS